MDHPNIHLHDRSLSTVLLQAFDLNEYDNMFTDCDREHFKIVVYHNRLNLTKRYIQQDVSKNNLIKVAIFSIDISCLFGLIITLISVAKTDRGKQECVVLRESERTHFI